MEYSMLSNYSNQDSLPRPPTMVEPREQFKQLAAYANELRSKQELSGAAYSKLIRLMALFYLERVIEKKFEAKLDGWTDKFSASMERYLEKLL